MAQGYLPPAICTDLTNDSISKAPALIWVVIDWKWGPQIPDWFNWMWEWDTRHVRGKDRQREREAVYGAGELWNVQCNSAPSPLQKNSGENLQNMHFLCRNAHGVYIFQNKSRCLRVSDSFSKAAVRVSNFSVSMKIGFHFSKREIWLEMEYYWFVPHGGVVWCRYMSIVHWLRGEHAIYIPSSICSEFLMSLTIDAEMVWQERLHQIWKELNVSSPSIRITLISLPFSI